MDRGIRNREVLAVQSGGYLTIDPVGNTFGLFGRVFYSGFEKIGDGAVIDQFCGLTRIKLVLTDKSSTPCFWKFGQARGNLIKELIREEEGGESRGQGNNGSRGPPLPSHRPGFITICIVEPGLLNDARRPLQGDQSDAQTLRT